MTVNRIAAGAAVCCAVMFASACGGGTAATGVPATSSTTAPTAAGAAGGTGTTGRSFPGASGLLAQIDGSTLQVQGTDAQVAVTYSAATTFTNTVPSHLSGIVVGACVQARSARTPTGAGGAAPTSAPSATSATSDPIKAVSVEISPAVNGTCAALGGLRPTGGPPPGSTGDANPPAGAPTPDRTRGPGGDGNGFAGNGFGAFGKVTAVSGASFTVESSRPQNGTATTASPVARTVETSATTTFTQTKAASSKALALGQCVTALGKGDDTGSISATSIALRPAENGACSTGFGGRGASGAPTSAGGGSGA